MLPRCFSYKNIPMYNENEREKSKEERRNDGEKKRERVTYAQVFRVFNINRRNEIEIK